MTFQIFWRCVLHILHLGNDLTSLCPLGMPSKSAHFFKVSGQCPQEWKKTVGLPWTALVPRISVTMEFINVKYLVIWVYQMHLVERSNYYAPLSNGRLWPYLKTNTVVTPRTLAITGFHHLDKNGSMRCSSLCNSSKLLLPAILAKETPSADRLWYLYMIGWMSPFTPWILQRKHLAASKKQRFSLLNTGYTNIQIATVYILCFTGKASFTLVKLLQVSRKYETC